MHILPDLGRLEAGKLNAKQIRDWHQTLAASPRRTRATAGPAAAQAASAIPQDTTRSAPAEPPPTAS